MPLNLFSIYACVCMYTYYSPGFPFIQNTKSDCNEKFNNLGTFIYRCAVLIINVVLNSKKSK